MAIKMTEQESVARARQQTLGDLPRRSAGRFPHKEAIIDGDVRLTFAEFDENIDRVAAAMAAQGLTKGSALALLSHNCWQFPVIAFAAARLGVILVPINFMLGPREIAYILDHSESVAFVAEDALVEIADEAMALTSGNIGVKAALRLSGSPVPAGWADVADWCGHARMPLPAVPIGDDDPVRLMYTSGTESRPKGVMLSSRSLMWQYTSCIVTGGMASTDIEIHALPLYHCAQLDNFLSTDIYLGATSIILRTPDPAEILRVIEAENVTNLFCPPTIWISLLRNPKFDQADLRSLSKGYYGASAMPVEILHEMGERLPNVRLWNFYGQTEMASLATALGPEDQFEHAGSAGFPALNVETRILDGHDEEVPSGVIGEIVHRSPHAALGYFKDEEKTAEAFRNGWFHSGDLGYMDDTGRLRFADRKKDTIKTGGENVASREVEEAIYQHHGVAEAAVFAVDHPKWIEAVAAAVVPRQGVHLTPEEIIKHCRSLLAGYKTPKYVVILDSLPKNPSGKILKRDLRDEYRGIATPEAATI
jgi:fatty-acyl-CoA synthase